MRIFLFFLLLSNLSLAQITLDSTVFTSTFEGQKQSEKVSYFYSEDGVLEKEIISEKVPNESKWFASRLTAYVNKQDTIEKFDSSSTLIGWKYSGSEIITYDDQKRKLSVIQYESDESASYTFTRKYNNKGNVEESFKGYLYDETLEIWKVGTKHFWTYNDNNDPTELQIQSWNMDSMRFEPTSKSFWVYDYINKSYTYSQLMWRENEQKYEEIASKRIEYQEDLKGHITRLEIFENEMNYRYFEFEYYDNGSIKSERYYGWSSRDLDWIPQSKTEYEVLKNVFFDDVSSPDYIKDNLLSEGLKNHSYIKVPFTIINPVTSRKSYIHENNDWVQVLEVRYHYSLVTGITENIAQPSHSYPNPAQLVIHLPESTYSIIIQDVSGRIILHLYNPSQTIDVSELENGSYILQLETDNGLVSEKLLISK